MAGVVAVNREVKALRCGKRQLVLDRVQVMGVLNVTPDSFSDGGQFTTLDRALYQVEAMIDAGADIIDIGGESTRPGAAKVGEQEEMERVCPVLEQVLSRFDVLVSIDTSTPALMRETIKLGAGMINDVRAFTREGALEAVADQDVALCIMHMQGDPQTMQNRPRYASVLDEVKAFLGERVEVLSRAGVAADRIVLDPGFGFGKSLEHNLQLLNHISDFCRMGYPVLVGLSRKSMLGAILNKEVDERMFGSIAGAVIAAYQGAKILRVHDVEETKDAMKVVDALHRGSV